MPRPNITSSIKSAKTPITPAGREILIVAPMVSGTATSGALVENILSELEFIKNSDKLVIINIFSIIY